MKHSTSKRPADDVGRLRILGVMTITSGLTFATLATVHHLFFSHSPFA